MHRSSGKLVLALVAGLVIAATARAQSLKVTVETTKSKVAVSAPKILVNSSKGYMIGSGDQDFGGLYVTDPVVPPEGVSLKPSLISWRSLSRVEFTNWDVKEGDHHFVKAKITLTNGSSREVFAWNPSNGSSFYPLSSIKLEGKMLVQGTEQEVMIEPGRDLKSLEFEISK